MRKRYIVTKALEPEGLYAESLPELSTDYEENLTPGLDTVVVARELEEAEVGEVLSRPHILAVEEDVEDHALGYNGFDDSALKYHQIDKAVALGAKGTGVMVAVLDTGIKLETRLKHFAERYINGQSFIPGELVEDENGHGDFCCVAATPDDSMLVVGKVLSNEGSGSRSGIIAGMNWAVEQGADILSMSLGGSGSSTAYDATIRAAKSAGCVVFAAAGNGGREDEPVNCPGNSPDAYCVAAIDHKSGKMADFSCRGPEVDFTAAGVGIKYDGQNWSGTSMATPLAARCYATVRGKANSWQTAYNAFLVSLEDTPAPAEADGAGVPKVIKGLDALVPGAPEPEPPTSTPLPTMSTSKFVVKGVKERTLITRRSKPWAIAEPVPEGVKSADSSDVCCGGRSSGCGGSYSSG
jgi:subtilisin